MRHRGLLVLALVAIGMLAVVATFAYGPSPAVPCSQMTTLGSAWYDLVPGSFTSHIDGLPAELCTPPSDGVFLLAGAVVAVTTLAMLVATFAWRDQQLVREGRNG